MTTEIPNIAETLAREMKAPEILLALNDHVIVTSPPGWKIDRFDLEHALPKPRRKIANVRLTETESFIDYLKHHGSLAHATIYCTAKFKEGNLHFTAILNDHGEQENQQDWRDHRARFTPEKSEEWKRWTEHDGSKFSQVEFASFLEENLKDITAGDGFPSGGNMLQMAVDFEAKQDMRFKSATRLQSGGVRMEYVADEDKNTIAAMQVFEKFQVGVPVFRADTQRYPIQARLRYRVKEGTLIFWYELIRPDLIMEQASRTLVDTVRGASGLPLLFGTPEA